MRKKYRRTYFKVLKSGKRKRISAKKFLLASTRKKPKNVSNFISIGRINKKKFRTNYLRS